MHMEKRVIGFVCVVLAIALCFLVQLPSTINWSLNTIFMVIGSGIIIPIILLAFGIKLIYEGTN